MFRHLIVSLSLLFVASSTAQESPEPGQSAVALISGNEHTGWDGDPKFWKIEDGVIVGETTEANPTKGNTFLIWQGGEIADFELTFKSRVLGNNSGIQYRSQVVDADSWAVGGYQMDLIGAPHLFGMLYEERGRGILAQRGQTVVLNPGADPQVVEQADTSAPLDVAEWNEYKIVARGNQLSHFVNGTPTAQVTDNDAEKRAASGVLAIQLHAGPPTRVELKDMVLTKLSGAVASVEPQWIWNSTEQKIETIYARRQWTQRGEAKSAQLQITCDNAFTAYLNGELLGSGDNWVNGSSFDIAPLLKAGDNVLAVEAVNEGGAAGLLARIEIVDANDVATQIVTDGQWQVTGELHEGWMAPSIDPAGWGMAAVIAPHGSAPWGSPLSRPLVKIAPGKLEHGAEVHPAGFEIEKIYNVPKETQGSWVAMAVDDKGRLYCSDQNEKGLFRVTLGTDGAASLVEKVPAEISGAQGLLWAHGALYAGLNRSFPGSGLFRVTDSDGDDHLDKVEALRQIRQGGEHGIHGVSLSPHGEDLFINGGNHSPTPAPDTSAVPLNYAEDQLLPPMPDARGHAAKVRAPGGWVARTDRDGKVFHLYAAGFRNQYDVAFNAHGEMFTYDSDMEWDLGTPWYRQTRIYHITGGSEFGWRTGSGKFPAHYPDVLPPALEVGPGSPTGVLSGLGSKFPAKYQNAIYAFDWTYGTIYAMHPVPVGSSYRMEKEEFVTGTPLNVTDGVIAPDGNFYFAVGGRGNDSSLYRVRYTGAEPTTPAPAPPGEGADLRQLRREMEALQIETAGAVDALWPHLGHDDRFIRYTARVALEHQPVASWVERAFAETGTQASLSALLALARQGTAEHRTGLLTALQKTFQSELSEAQQLEALRVLGLAMIRMGSLDPAQAATFRDLLSPRFPATSDALNRELIALLVALDAPDAIAKTVPMMAQESSEENPGKIDEDLLARAGLGQAFAAAQNSGSAAQGMWYAYALRNAKVGWTPELQRAYFTWFARARNFKGGASYAGFLDNIRDEALAAIGDESLRTSLAELSSQPARTVPEGFENARAISVGVLPGLKFATELLTAKPGEKLALVFINDDPMGMMHNLAIAAPGSLQKIVNASMTPAADAVEKNFIPDLPEILASTPQVAPKKKFTLYFTVPAEPGDYPYVCTYPGHGLIMNGVLKVGSEE